MASPIFFPALFKKYIVQTRSKSGPWQEHRAYRSLERAKGVAQELRRQNAEREVRILNRLTGQVVG